MRLPCLSPAARPDGQHLLVSCLHGGPRFGAEPFREGPAQHPVHLQRLGLPVRPVQGEHQLPVERFPQRMPGGQPGQLRDELRGIVAESEPGLHPPLQELQTLLLEPVGVGEVDELRPDARQWGAAPQRESRPRPLRHFGPAPGRSGCTGRDHTTPEDPDIEFTVLHHESVSGAQTAQPARVVEHPPQPCGEVLQRGSGRGRRAVPQRVLQRLGCHDPSWFPQQRRQQGADHGAAHRARLPRDRIKQADRPEQTEAQPVRTPVPYLTAPAHQQPALPSAC